MRNFLFVLPMTHFGLPIQMLQKLTLPFEYCFPRKNIYTQHFRDIFGLNELLNITEFFGL